MQARRVSNAVRTSRSAVMRLRSSVSSNRYMKMLVSINSPLIHFVSGEFATTRAHLPTQFLDQCHGGIGATFLPYVICQPTTKLFVQCRLFGACPFTGSFDQMLVGTQGNVFHRPVFHENGVHGCSVHC